jgi:ABC-2 type transport system ATP-binding protein
MSVRGTDHKEIGELAAKLSVVLYELTPQSESLEEAFMELTESSIEYHGAATASTAANDDSVATREGK